MPTPYSRRSDVALRIDSRSPGMTSAPIFAAAKVSRPASFSEAPVQKISLWSAMMKRSWQIPQTVFVNLPHCVPKVLFRECVCDMAAVELVFIFRHLPQRTASSASPSVWQLLPSTLQVLVDSICTLSRTAFRCL